MNLDNTTEPTFTNIYNSNRSGNIRLLIADDHLLVRNALRNLFLKQPDMEVVAEASNGQEAVEFALKLIPDIILMDISMPVLNGSAATKMIKASNPKIDILVLTVHSDIEHAISIMEAGADGFLTKTASDEELVQAIRSIYAGDTVLTPDVYRNLFKYTFKYFKKPVNLNLVDQLSSKELTILRLVARGDSNKKIASDLNISISSVKSYLTIIFLKLHATSRTEAIAICLQSGILAIEDLE